MPSRLSLALRSRRPQDLLGTVARPPPGMGGIQILRLCNVNDNLPWKMNRLPGKSALERRGRADCSFLPPRV
jgi:hypothetical protein